MASIPVVLLTCSSSSASYHGDDKHGYGEEHDRDRIKRTV